MLETGCVARYALKGKRITTGNISLWTGCYNFPMSRINEIHLSGCKHYAGNHCMNNAVLTVTATTAQHSVHSAQHSTVASEWKYKAFKMDSSSAALQRLLKVFNTTWMGFSCWSSYSLLTEKSECRYVTRWYVQMVLWFPHRLPITEPLRKSATPKRTPMQRARMKGRRRPQLRVQRSLAEPISGVKIKPRIGLRNQVRL